MTGAAIVLALASALCFGLALTLTQFGLRDATPSAGAAISIPTSTLLFMLAAPYGLAGSLPQWSAVPVFAGVGLLFPAAVTLITFEANRRLGPVVAGSLGNLAPVFAVLLAFLLLGEPLRVGQLLGLAVILAGIAALTAPAGNQITGWRSWYMALPLAAAVLRGFIQPVIKLGLAVWPSVLWACLIGYITSSLVVLTVQRVRKGSFVVQAPRAGLFWFAMTGISNGLSALTLFAAVRNGPITLVAPLAAIYPLVTLALSAMLLKHIEITARIVAGSALTVLGVALVLIG